MVFGWEEGPLSLLRHHLIELKSIVPPLNGDHAVIGLYVLKRGRLTFRTGGSLLAQEALQAKSAGRDFTVRLASDSKEVTGRVLNVELIESVKPAQWEIVLRV